MVQLKGEMMEASDFAALASARSRLFWLLSRLFLAPPEERFLAELKTLNWCDEGEPTDDLERALTQLLRGAREAKLLELQVEHLRLFGGVRMAGGPPPPYESLYREGRCVGYTTAEVVNHYRRNGISLAEEGVGPEDHLGSELKFLALLGYEESRRWRDGNRRGGRQALSAQQRFIEAHPGAWAPAYCRRLAAETQSPFYQGVALATAAGIEQAAEQISSLLEELPQYGNEHDSKGELQ